MIKADIVKQVGEHLRIKPKDALVIVDEMITVIKHIVSDQGRLEIRDFGIFQTKRRKQRLGRNPKDKKEYPIPPRRVVTFKMGKELKLSGEKQARAGIAANPPSVARDGGIGNTAAEQK